MNTASSIEGHVAKRRPFSPHRLGYLGLLMLWGLGQQTVGCMTIEQMAPPIDVEFAEFAMRRGMAVETLEAGRHVYLADCTRCHSVEPIARYSKAKWDSILPRMCKESKLDGAESEAVRAYVLATCDVLAVRAEAKRTKAAVDSAHGRAD